MRLYLKDVNTQKLIEVLKANSIKSEMLLECINAPTNIQVNSIVIIDKEKLKNKIKDLISKRENNVPIDFGKRFEYKQCYNILEFEKKEYILETSGNDNLIIFMLNIFHSGSSMLLVTDSK